MDENSSTEPRFADALKKALSLFEPGDELGAYTIVRELGGGSFGDVFLARQNEPVVRDVALKILKPGRDSRRVLGRFDAEQQAMAVMHHSNIATFHDAGVAPSGRPYFVMEYIDGLPVTAYCDEHRLGVEQRLRLFLEVCRGVEHAHQKGVIHRDLKPGNVLVAPDGDAEQVKVIDFGIAKAVDQPMGGQATEIGQMIGTPEYMAPEQARVSDEGVDTRSDVYSLGALLYAMLVGVPPLTFERRDVASIQQEICEREPERLSGRYRGLEPAQRARIAGLRGVEERELLAQLQHELDWITRKCLRKDPGHRYLSVSSLIEDVQRYLNGFPVEAGPPSAGYRVRKFLRRHRAEVGAGVGLAAVLLVGLVITTVLATRLTEERTRNRQIRVDGFVDEARILAIQDGFPAEAFSRLDAALQLNPNSAMVKTEQGYLLAFQGNTEAAIERLEAVVAEHPEHRQAAVLLAGLQASDEDTPPDVAADRWLLARALAAEGSERKIELLSRAIAVNDWYFDAIWMRAAHYYQMDRLDEARADAELLRRVRPDLPIPWILRGGILAAQGHTVEAIDDLDRALDLHPESSYARFNRAWCLHHLGRNRTAVGDADWLAAQEGGDFLTADLVGRIYLGAERHGDAERWLVRAVEQYGEEYRTWIALSNALEVQGKLEEALDAIGRAVDLAPANPVLRSARAALQAELGRFDEGGAECEAIDALGYPARAQAVRARVERVAGRFDTAIGCGQSAVDEAPEKPGFRLELAMSAWAAGEFGAAREEFREAALFSGFEWAWLCDWELAAIQGDLDGAGRALRAAAESDVPWLVDVAGYLDGSVPESRILLPERSYDERLAARYYIAVKHRQQGRDAEAAESFRRARQYYRIDYVEHELAGWHLEGRDVVRPAVALSAGHRR